MKPCCLKLPILFFWNLRHQGLYLILVVSGNAFQTTYSHRLFFHPSSPASRLTGPVTSSSEDAREHVGLPVDHVWFRVFSFSDKSNIFWDRGMCRARILTIDYLMEILGILNIRRLHSMCFFLSNQPKITGNPDWPKTMKWKVHSCPYPLAPVDS